jgi:hypothetical protein
MRVDPVVFALLACCSLGFAQDKAAPAPAKSVTVAATIDHNRVVVDVEVPLPDGSTQKVQAWVDNGDPDLEMSRRLATVLGLKITCDDRSCTSPPPTEIYVGGMKIPLDALKLAKIPLPSVGAAVLASGMKVEINLPSTVLRRYDVLIDYPGHKFTIGEPGTVRFRGSSSKVHISSENGLIQIPSEIERKKYNLALDVGSSMSFLSAELFDKLAETHADWPRMTGAVGSANAWGGDDEKMMKLMRVDRLQYGPLFLTNVAVAELSKATAEFFAKRAGMPTAGLLGGNELVNYRVGIDYAHSVVYFDIGRLFNFPDFDVVGVILRPEDDGRFSILGVADFDGKPSVEGVQAGDHLVAVDGIPVPGSTMGQVWSMLGGTPGQERRLTVERAGNEFGVAAKVRVFLGEVETEERKKK